MHVNAINPPLSALQRDYGAVWQICRLKMRDSRIRQIQVGVIIRFPEDNPGRSTLDPNFFAPDDPMNNPSSIVRDTARNNYAANFMNFVNDIWGESTVFMYVVPDLNTGLTIGGMDAATSSFITVQNGGTSDAFKALINKNIGGIINVYLVQQIEEIDKSGVKTFPALGTTLGLHSADERKVIVLEDAGSAAASIARAHELGHSLTLPDIKTAADVKGNLNNLLDVMNQVDAMRLLLMNFGDHGGRLITNVESDDARTAASGMKGRR